MLSVKSVTKNFGRVRALDGMDLEIPKQGIFGLVGPNGAGKTTLFNIISGFLNPDAGEVLVGGYPVRPGHPPPPGTIAILPQDAGFLGHVKLGPLLTYYAKLSGFKGSDAKREVERVLNLVQLPEVVDRTADQLSHGMRKRVGVAQCFIGNPRLVILDEPTAGLDPHAAREIRGLIRTVGADRVVVVSSHNLFELQDMCSEVAIIHAGRRVRQGPVEEIAGGDAPEVSFKMPASPAQAALDAIQAQDFVDSVVWDPGAGRLRITVQLSRPAQEAAGALVTVLAQQGVAFQDMRVGATLEDRFVQDTGQG